LIDASLENQKILDSLGFLISRKIKLNLQRKVENDGTKSIELKQKFSQAVFKRKQLYRSLYAQVASALEIQAGISVLQVQRRSESKLSKIGEVSKRKILFWNPYSRNLFL
jgi:hypothetical protein